MPTSPPPPPTAEDLILGPPSMPEVRPRAVLARIVTSLAVATVLSSGELVAVAEAQPFGTRRTILVEVAHSIDDHAARLHLDEPGHRLRSALGRRSLRDEPSEQHPDSNRRSPLNSGREQAPPLGLRPPRPHVPEAARPLVEEPTSPQPQTTEPVPPPIRVVEEASRLRLWAGGDSLGEYVGNQLLHPITDAALVEVTLDYRISTGLTRPDYFDWPGRLAEVMATAPAPEVLVFMVGGNDNQNMAVDGEIIESGTPAWSHEYERRVLSVVDATAGSRLYWIGLPPMRDEARNSISLQINEVLRRVAEEHAAVTFVDLETQFAGPSGTYSPHIVAPDGEVRVARAADGVHITYAASTWVAVDVWASIEDRWSFLYLNEGARPQRQPQPDLPR